MMMLQANSKVGWGMFGVRGRWRCLAPALSLIVGCGIDPGTGRIPAGMMASVHGGAGRSVPVFFSGKTEQLPVGATVMVIADREGDEAQPRRKVLVSLQSGPSRGLAAQMYRSDLRPSD
jgi:hypothetical protein